MVFQDNATSELVVRGGFSCLIKLDDSGMAMAVASILSAAFTLAFLIFVFLLTVAEANGLKARTLRESQKERETMMLRSTRRSTANNESDLDLAVITNGDDVNFESMYDVISPDYLPALPPPEVITKERLMTRRSSSLQDQVNPPNTPRHPDYSNTFSFPGQKQQLTSNNSYLLLKELYYPQMSVDPTSAANRQILEEEGDVISLSGEFEAGVEGGPVGGGAGEDDVVKKKKSKKFKDRVRRYTTEISSSLINERSQSEDLNGQHQRLKLMMLANKKSLRSSSLRNNPNSNPGGGGSEAPPGVLLLNSSLYELPSLSEERRVQALTTRRGAGTFYDEDSVSTFV